LTKCDVVSEQKQGDQAIVGLDCGDGKQRSLAFRKEDGNWRVDI